jgi:hypothetical protein
MAKWSDVKRLALRLPGTSETTSYGNAAWAVAKNVFAWERPLGRADVAALGDAAPTGPVLGIRTADLEMKEALLAWDRDVFFTTPHFDGYAAVLIRLDAISLKQLEQSLQEAWLAQAPKRLALEFGGTIAKQPAPLRKPVAKPPTGKPANKTATKKNSPPRRRVGR